MSMRAITALVALLLLATTASAQAPAGRPALAVEKGSTVLLEYTVKDDAGTVIDSNKGQAPLSFVQGEEQLVPGLDRALVGMRPGQEKKVQVKPEDAYGPVDPTAQMEVPRSTLPSNVSVGATLSARDPNGRVRTATVKAIKDQIVVLDLNHPLAGKTLVFEVKVLGVEPPGGAPDVKATPRPPTK